MIIADEITSALDSSVQAEILNLLRALQDERRLAFVLVTHDLSIAHYMCDDISVLYLGRVVEQGPVGLLREPSHPYTRLLLDSVPDPGGEFLRRPGAATAVEPSDPAHPPAGCSFHPRCSRPGRRDQDLVLCARDLPALTDDRDGDHASAACHFPLMPTAASRGGR